MYPIILCCVWYIKKNIINTVVRSILIYSLCTIYVLLPTIKINNGLFLDIIVWYNLSDRSVKSVIVLDMGFHLFNHLLLKFQFINLPYKST